jgi:hypothetical protein
MLVGRAVRFTRVGSLVCYPPTRNFHLFVRLVIGVWT